MTDATRPDIEAAAHAINAMLTHAPALVEAVAPRILELPLLSDGDITALIILLPRFTALADPAGVLTNLITRSIKYVESARLPSTTRILATRLIVPAIDAARDLPMPPDLATLTDIVAKTVGAFTRTLAKPIDAGLETALETGLASVLGPLSDASVKAEIVAQQAAKLRQLLDGSADERMEAVHRLSVFSTTIPDDVAVRATIRLLADPTAAVQLTLTDLLIIGRVVAIDIPAEIPTGEPLPETDADDTLSIPMKSFDPGNQLYRQRPAYLTLCSIYGISVATAGGEDVPVKADVRRPEIRAGLLSALCRSYAAHTSDMLTSLSESLEVDTVDAAIEAHKTIVLRLNLMRRVLPVSAAKEDAVVVDRLLERLSRFIGWAIEQACEIRIKCFEYTAEWRRQTDGALLMGGLGTSLFGHTNTTTRSDTLMTIAPLMARLTRLTELTEMAIHTLVGFLDCDLTVSEPVLSVAVQVVVKAAASDHDAVRRVCVDAMTGIVARHGVALRGVIRVAVADCVDYLTPHSAVLLGQRYRDNVALLVKVAGCVKAQVRAALYAAILAQLDLGDTQNKRDAVSLMPGLVTWIEKDSTRHDFTLPVATVHRKLAVVMRALSITDTEGVLTRLQKLEA